MSSSESTSSALRFAATDFLPGTDMSSDSIVRALASGTPELDRDVASADLVLYSVFGSRHRVARGTTVSWNGEPWIRESQPAHWSIDWRHLARPNHLHLPFWAKSLMSQGLADDSTGDSTGDPALRFCNFIYSNASCGMRNAFFQMLDAREPVDALGVVHHNADHPGLAGRKAPSYWISKRAVLSEYRFTIAFESEEHVGYTTEKLTDAWLGDSIPIYWGNPAVTLDFPVGSYLSLYEAGSMARLVEMVLEAHHAPDRYEALRLANPFRTGHLAGVLERYRLELAAFAALVVDDARAHQGRPRRSLVAALRDHQRLAVHELKEGVRRRVGP